MDKRIAVISDIHSNFSALQAVSSDFFDKVDEVWFLGDLFGYCDDFLQVFNHLEKIVMPTVWLAGNHDLALLGNESLLNMMNPRAKAKIIQQQQLLTLSIERKLKKIPGRVNMHKPLNITLSHGVPGKNKLESVINYDRRMIPKSPLSSENEALKRRKKYTPRAKLWIMGHSHNQIAWQYHAGNWSQIIKDFGLPLNGSDFMDVSLNGRVKIDRAATIFIKDIRKDDLIILNPGSVGKPRDGYFNDIEQKRIAKYLLLHLTNEYLQFEFRFVPYVEERGL